MMKAILLAVGLAIAATSGAASQSKGQETYDLLFRNGTLDEIDRKQSLLYSRDVTNTEKPDTEDRDTGEIALSILNAESEMAHLEFRQDGKHRALGRFPASVGNPMIMYFYETVVRDMAETAGGSPFYIRNRVKDSLIQPAVIERGEVSYDGRMVSTVTVSLMPFAEDPNKDRMRGFGDLELRVTMSEEVPGWYLSLVAEVQPAGAAEAIYRSSLSFEGLEAN